MTCGPWRAVRLETYRARISDLRVDYQVDASLRRISGSISASVEGESGNVVNFTASLEDKLVFKGTAEVDDEGVAQVEFLVSEPKLWYPHGYGDQPLYTVTATVRNDEINLHTASRKTGFRKGELIQKPDEIGKSFYFRINNIDVFCGGSDWIPADSFTPRVTVETYRRWLQMMVDGYQVMIRYVYSSRTVRGTVDSHRHALEKEARLSGMLLLGLTARSY